MPKFKLDIYPVEYVERFHEEGAAAHGKTIKIDTDCDNANVRARVRGFLKQFGLDLIMNEQEATPPAPEKKEEKHLPIPEHPSYWAIRNILEAREIPFEFTTHPHRVAHLVKYMREQCTQPLNLSGFEVKLIRNPYMTIWYNQGLLKSHIAFRDMQSPTVRAIKYLTGWDDATYLAYAAQDEAFFKTKGTPT